MEFTATEVAEAKTLCDFKKELDSTLGAKGIRGAKGDQDVEFDDQP